MTAGTPLRELAALFLRLGVTAFGRPAAHIAMMRDEVVDRRRWLIDREFLDLVAATNLIPGPNSTELAIHAMPATMEGRIPSPGARRPAIRSTLANKESPKSVHVRPFKSLSRAAAAWTMAATTSCASCNCIAWLTGDRDRALRSSSSSRST